MRVMITRGKDCRPNGWIDYDIGVGKQRKTKTKKNDPDAVRKAILYHFCRLQLPGISLSPAQFENQLQRAYQVYHAKEGTAALWARFLDNLHFLDWYLASACLEGDPRAWEYLFAARAGRSDCLLIDALRARAARLYPRDEERQENAVTDFWGVLLVSQSPDSPPILARHDGQRPLVPWLIRVFQNWHVSKLRNRHESHPFPECDVTLPLPQEEDGRWHDVFRSAARESFKEFTENEILILGLRLRYRMSQREVAALLGVHEGTISRQTTQLRDRCLEAIGRRLVEEGWTGDDLSGLVLNEMGSLLMDEPRLAANQLARLLARRGRGLPKDPGRE
jgi:RNA polymerase sigma factor (sigma-70 family)